MSQNPLLLMSPMMLHFCFLFVFLRVGVSLWSFFPPKSVRRELHKYAQSCTQLQADRTCKNATISLLLVHHFVTSLCESDFTTLGMKVYLKRLNKAGKLVPRVRKSKSGKKIMFYKAGIVGTPSHSYQLCVTYVAGLWNVLLWVYPKCTQVCI